MHWLRRTGAATVRREGVAGCLPFGGLQLESEESDAVSSP